MGMRECAVGRGAAHRGVGAGALRRSGGGPLHGAAGRATPARGGVRGLPPRAGLFDTNRERMRYDEFRARGLCVGSGVVEAACKTVVGERCMRSGMRWTVDEANAILALRCSVLSGRYEDYWERRAEVA